MIEMIVAMGTNNCIGINNSLPWHEPLDLAWFKKHTLGKTIVMGRNTYESIGKPLPNRRNIVLTSKPIEGVECLTGIDELLNQDIMVIGGASVYEVFLPYTDKLYLTRMNASPEGDTFFPPISTDWCVKSSVSVTGEQLDMVFEILCRE